ncbi:uncharacterized protein LOC129335786 [Eublepharis macularius]|uniref:Uncharacterized protein LOC129335786 n=1 Tax=Eublepharis macularius TaxID=481883 RepID=A0AA97JUY7_EUBMA|nr:uncharacterized protein LOC129335786 [Eublepharis macularius]
MDFRIFKQNQFRILKNLSIALEKYCGKRSPRPGDEPASRELSRRPQEAGAGSPRARRWEGSGLWSGARGRCGSLPGPGAARALPSVRLKAKAKGRRAGTARCRARLRGCLCGAAGPYQSAAPARPGPDPPSPAPGGGGAERRPARRPMARLLLALLLLGALRAAASGGGVSAERPGGACGKPKDIENAVLEDNGSMRLRYSCVKDYKRKAGTSSLIVCEKKKTNKYEWSNSNLRCIRDPSKPFPESEHTTEDTRKESKALTPSGQPAPPKTSATPAVVSGDPYGSKTTSPPDLNTATTLLRRTTKPSSDGPTTMETPRRIGGGVSGTDPKNVMQHKRTTTQDSHPESSKPSFSTLSTEVSSPTATPSRNTPENTTWLSKMDIPHGQAGSVQLQAVLLPVVFIMLSFVIAGLWCFYRKHGCFQRQRVVEEIPMAEISEERSKMISADTDLEDAGPSEERTPVQLSDCATSNG